MQTHRLFNWIAGDDWLYRIRLEDENGQPYDLDGLSAIKWLIHNASGQIVAHEYRITKLEPASDGNITVFIPHDQTTLFAGGLYVDWLRIVCDNGIVTTLLTGPIAVTADPWRASVATRTAAAIRRSGGENVVVLLDRKERIARQALAAGACGPKTVCAIAARDNDCAVAAAG